MYSFQNVLEESDIEYWTVCQDNIKPERWQSVNVNKLHHATLKQRI